MCTIQAPADFAAHCGRGAIPANIAFISLSALTTTDEFPVDSMVKVVQVHQKHEVVRTNMELYSVDIMCTTADLAERAVPRHMYTFKAICKITADETGRKALLKEAYILGGRPDTDTDPDPDTDSDSDTDTDSDTDSDSEPNLKELQDDAVPKLYGYFQDAAGGNDRVGLLLLQYVGPQLRRPFRCLPASFSLEAIAALRDIHLAGFVLRNFRESSIFVRMDAGGEQTPTPVIYNFDIAEPHVCKAPESVLCSGIPRPRQEDILCHEIYGTLSRADVWTPELILLDRRIKVTNDIDSAQSLVEYYKQRSQQSDQDTTSDLERAAELAFTKFKEWRNERDRKDQMAFSVELQPGEYWDDWDITTL